MKHWKMKNEKFLLDIQTKCGVFANEILYATINAERTFECKWPKHIYYHDWRSQMWNEKLSKFWWFII